MLLKALTDSPDHLIILVYCISEPPTITIAPQNKTVKEGSLVKITCKATGNPPPNVTWSKDGQTVGKNRDLEIQEVNRNDSGMYECQVNNGVGLVKTASALVTVQCKYERFAKLLVIS